MKVALTNLLPGATYSIQVRTKSGTEVSEWSRVFTVTATSDTLPPGVPGGFEVIASGDNFFASWVAPALDGDGGTLNDLSHYELSIYNGIDEYIVKTTNTNYLFSFAENVTTFDPPAPILTFKVRSVDQTSNESAYTSPETVENPPPAEPTNFTTTGVNRSIQLHWDAVEGVIGYHVHASNVNPDFIPSNGNRVWQGSSTGFTYATDPYVETYFKIAAVDGFGRVSTYAVSNGHSLPESDGLPPDGSPKPEVIGGIGSLFINWQGITNADAVSYKVHVAELTGFATSESNRVLTTDATSATIKTLGLLVIDEIPTYPALEYDKDYFVKIVAFDQDGNATESAEGVGQLFKVESPDINVGSVRAEHVLAGEIRASHLSTDFLQSGVLQTASLGRRVVIDAQGIHLIEQDESLLVDLPTDSEKPAAFNGSAIISSLSVRDMEIGGPGNEFSQGSEVILASGITASSSPPVVFPAFPTTPSNFTNLDNSRTAGMHYENTDRWYIKNVTGGSKIQRVDPSDVRSEYDLYTGGAFAAVGITTCNEPSGGAKRFFVIGKNVLLNKWVIRKYSYTGFPAISKLAEYNFVGDHIPSTAWIPQIGKSTVADEFVTAYVNANRSTIQLKRYNGNGTLISTVNSAAVPELASMTDVRVRGVSFGPHDLALGNVWMVAMADRVWFFSPTGVRQASQGFATNGTHNAFCWEDTNDKFIGLSTDDTVETRYTDWNKNGAQNVQMYAGYTWADTVGTTHETTVSVTKQFQMIKRAQLTISTPPIPAGIGSVDDVNAVKTYVGTSPVRTSLFKQTDPADGISTIVLPAGPATSGANPPAANNFPTEGPAVFTSAIKDAGGVTGRFEVKGDGTGQWLPEAWHMVGVGGEPAFTGSWTNKNLSAYPKMQFRKDQFGMVHLRGCVTGTSSAGGVAVFTLPTGYRPPTPNGDLIVPIIGVDGAAIVRLSVDSGGVVALSVLSATWTAANWHFIDNVRVPTV